MSSRTPLYCLQNLINAENTSATISVSLVQIMYLKHTHITCENLLFVYLPGFKRSNLCYLHNKSQWTGSYLFLLLAIGVKRFHVLITCTRKITSISLTAFLSVFTTHSIYTNLTEQMQIK